MKWQFMGTAAAEGFPAVFCECDTCRRAREAGGKNLRMRSGLIINDTTMIDLCPDALTFSQRFGVKLSAIRDLFFTHSHCDHCDVEELSMRRNPVFCQLPDDRPLNVYMNDTALERLKGYMPYDDASYMSYLNITMLEHFKPFQTENGLTLTHLPADHAGTEASGFYLIEDGEKTAVYAHDTGFFLPETMAFLKTKSIDLISLDCTFGKNTRGGYGHMGIPDNRLTVKELREAGALKEDATVIIHHFTHNCGQLHEELEAEVKDDGWLVSYDGMIVEI